MENWRYARIGGSLFLGWNEKFTNLINRFGWQCFDAPKENDPIATKPMPTEANQQASQQTHSIHAIHAIGIKRFSWCEFNCKHSAWNISANSELAMRVGWLLNLSPLKLNVTPNRWPNY